MHIYRLINRIIRMTCAAILVALHICETETIDRSMQLFQKKKKKIRTTLEEEKTMYLLFDEITLLSFRVPINVQFNSLVSNVEIVFHTILLIFIDDAISY